MKIIRNLKWKMADRFPSLDKKTLYYNPRNVDEIRPKVSGLDAVMAAMAGMILIAIGLFGIVVGLFVLFIIFTG